VFDVVYTPPETRLLRDVAALRLPHGAGGVESSSTSRAAVRALDGEAAQVSLMRQIAVKNLESDNEYRVKSVTRGAGKSVVARALASAPGER